MYEKELTWLLKEKYAGKETPEFLRDKARVISGEPVDYVIGWKDFLGCRIYLNHRPLIPRIETEYWAEMLLDGLQARPPARVLDLFCGSGAIGIAIAKAFPKADVVFGDLNTSALEQTRENIEQNSVRGTVVRSNVFERIEGVFNLIVANPPYIPHGSADLGEITKTYEPHDALYAKEEGLEFVRELLENARQHLAPEGIMAIEFDDPQQSAIEKLGKENGWTMGFEKDQFGLWRVVFCT